MTISNNTPPVNNPPHAHCSFCGRPRAHAGPMAEGPDDVYICAECIRLAAQIAEADPTQPTAPDLNDPTICHDGHMHIRCYFYLRKNEHGKWTATARSPAGAFGEGNTPREAVRNLQTNLLAATLELLRRDQPPGDHFTNHAAPAFR